MTNTEIAKLEVMFDKYFKGNLLETYHPLMYVDSYSQEINPDELDDFMSGHVPVTGCVKNYNAGKDPENKIAVQRRLISGKTARAMSEDERVFNYITMCLVNDAIIGMCKLTNGNINKNNYTLTMKHWDRYVKLLDNADCVEVKFLLKPKSYSDNS